MARRINAPGIEINEIDRSWYDQTVNNGTAGTATLIFGFADKGDDYSVRWMNNMTTFVQTYGEPTNDAERYFYNAAYEVIDGGGVCYTSKLPYCNDSQDNYVYTSYTIDQHAKWLPDAMELVCDAMRSGSGRSMEEFLFWSGGTGEGVTSLTADEVFPEFYQFSVDGNHRWMQ